MEKISGTILFMTLLFFLSPAYSQKPLFNDTLPIEEMLHKKQQPYVISESPIRTIPKSFNAEDLLVKDSDGNVVKDLTKSPCWPEIGYNPNMSRQMILDEYANCEWEKKKSHIITVLSVIGVTGFFSVIILSHFNRSNRKGLT